jgi:threonyl-tRNA synthetase
MATETIAVRTRTGQDLGSMSLTAFVELLQTAIARRGRTE